MMKKLIVLAVASLVATSAMAGEMKWNGSAGMRYTSANNDDSLSSTSTAVGTSGKSQSVSMTKAYALRANLGVTGGWENVEWGMGMRTTSSANSDWANPGSSGDLTWGLSQAWFRYLHDFGAFDMAATFGRQKNIFAHDMFLQSMFDNDVNFDGLGWQFKFGMFGLNMSQYILGAKSQGANGTATQTYTGTTDAVATTQSRFNYLFGFQPYMNWKFTDEIETMFAFGYYVWNDDSLSNGTRGGYTGTNNSATATTTAIAAGTFQVDNPKQLHIYNTWTLPYGFDFAFEWIKNKKQVYDVHSVGFTTFSGGVAKQEADSAAWSLALNYGKVKKAHDWSLSYGYLNKGLASVANTYSWSTIKPDNKAHVLKAVYALADGFNFMILGAKASEKAKKNVANGLAYSGANAGQNQKLTYLEIGAGVSF